MIALKISAPGRFMSALLSGTLFDSFLLQEATLKMAVTWQIDGRLVRDFYDKEEWEDREVRPHDLVSWKEVRSHFHSLIRGRKAPAAFSLVLKLTPEEMEKLMAGGGLSPDRNPVSSCSLVIRFAPSDLQVVTGTAFQTFTLDKTAETIWDRAVPAFLSAHDIEYEQLI